MRAVRFSCKVNPALACISGLSFLVSCVSAAAEHSFVSMDVVNVAESHPAGNVQTESDGRAQIGRAEGRAEGGLDVRSTTYIPHSIVPIARALPSTVDPCIDETTSSLPKQGGFSVDQQIRLADFGRTDPNGAAFVAEVFTISPEQKRAALLINRANPESNSYCQRIVIVQVATKGDEVEVARGGEFIRGDFQLRNFPVVYAGSQKSNPPLWSPDGSRIAYLRRHNESTQVWIVNVDGQSKSWRATDLRDDIERFAWADDGMGFVVETRPSIRKQAEAIAYESRQGFLFDERFSPQFVGRPIPSGSIEVEHLHVNLVNGTIRKASPSERATLSLIRSQTVSQGARLHSRSSRGHEAWVEPKHSDLLFSATRLVVTDNDGHNVRCDGKICEGVFRTWWSNAGDTLFALQRTGWGNSQTSLLSWRMGASQPNRILITDDVLFGCRMATDEIVCARESASRPRHLVAIDPMSLTERVVYDPNDKLRVADFGNVQRFRFLNEFGVESYADLVVPKADYPGQKFPMVVVGYTSDGFLRGGTGDEVPIHPLANRGIAVLSFHRPFLSSVDREARSEKELMKGNRKDWKDRRSVQSSLETAIQMAVETGFIDAERLGITGFSDGVATAQWALINSPRFRAVSLSSLGEDKYSYFLQAGPSFIEQSRASGYKILEEDNEGFWAPFSLIENVEHIDAAILVQAADTEYEGGLDVFEVFSHAGKAIEMYVFEDESHVKWQPAHRLAIYQRNVEWFEFWLAGKMNCETEKVAQYRRWLVMRNAPKETELVCA